MYDLLADAAAIVAALCVWLPLACTFLMFVLIVVLGVPEPPKDGER